MPPLSDPAPVGDVIARYSAEQMPPQTIAGLQHQAITDLNAGEITSDEALRVVNLLLTIALQKLLVVA